MLFKVAALASIASLALANPQAYNAGDGVVRTVTTYATQEITVTDCAATVTDCPARVMTSSYAVVTTIAAALYTPVPAVVALATGATGTGAAGAYGANTATYNMPEPTGYNGPSFTGAGNQLAAGGALAAVGAVAALFI